MIGGRVEGAVTPHGFIAGPVTVELMCEGRQPGSVALRLITPCRALQVYVTKTGKVRVWTEGGHEWKEQQVPASVPKEST